MSESTECCGSTTASEQNAKKQGVQQSGCCSQPEVQPKSESCCASTAIGGSDDHSSGSDSCCGVSSTVSAPVVASEAGGGSCCGSVASADSGSEGSSCCDEKPGIDWILWGSLVFVVCGYLGYWLIGGYHETTLGIMMHTSVEMVHAMWWGILSAAFFVGLLGRIPRELVMSVLGQGGTAGGLFRATAAGLLLDLCNHGILMVGMKLYERGASLGQVMAFLIASPWNSLTLTLILVGLIGLQWTLIFILGSLVIAWCSGWIFERLVDRGTLPANPHQVDFVKTPFLPTLKETWRQNDWSVPALTQMFWEGLKESRSVLRWVLLGIVMVALIRAFVPEDVFGTWFGATLSGLFLTLLATTVIEVCSEGSSPIAADLVNRAAAPGNAFTFLMAGAATDYTEIMAIRDTMSSWKIALYLPLVTVPQVLLLGYLMNLAG